MGIHTIDICSRLNKSPELFSVALTGSLQELLSGTVAVLRSRNPGRGWQGEYSAFFHQVHHEGGFAVTYGEPALQHRNAGFASFLDKFHTFVIELLVRY